MCVYVWWFFNGTTCKINKRKAIVIFVNDTCGNYLKVEIWIYWLEFNILKNNCDERKKEKKQALINFNFQVNILLFKKCINW